MATKRLSDVKLVDSFNGTPKGRVFETPSKKLYKILGFDLEASGVEVFAVRILRKTFKPSRKQPIFEVFKFEDTLNQKIKIPFLK